MKKRARRVPEFSDQVQRLAPVLPPQLRALALRMQQRRPPCLLCGGPFHALGIFVPHEPKTWGVAAGWQAGCAFGLCQRCVVLPDREAQVETALWQSRQQATAPWN